MLYPMFAMVMLTMLVLVYMAVIRVRSVANKQVDAKYFRLMEGDGLPRHVAQAGRHVANLFETPVLFYAAGILTIVMNLSGTLTIALGWAYVGCRLVHAAIHLTYNHPLHRMLAFVLSLLCIMGLWLILIIK
ncbi:MULTISPECIES: MAPEG family protein [Corallincola]|uniref:MAPEG family protein n=3 Tax=Corallincola TaxID=1775176 RepID=A0A368NIJ9_9GAMM|nr:MULTISPECIES: MAPEG family protein [Corallincola]RCU49249.1 MAPEG family protein [Corallincola holothuriorum]TAA47449.1 MAPEG family protein [Corallincola spongiicola]TCI05123.1 MAPEG family protein [Corallincola luteus]